MIKHNIKIFLWFFRNKKSELDLLGQAFLSVSSRWHAELNPVLTYVSLFDILRQDNFNGSFLEFGGGYSTVIAANMLGKDKVRIVSVDINPSKYDLILNSKANRISFLNSIDSIPRITVTYPEVLIGLEAIRIKLKQYERINTLSILKKFVKVGDAELQTLLSAIYSATGDLLLELTKKHPNYSSDLYFYEKFTNEDTLGYCSDIVKHGLLFDAIFFDCGELSSVGEWNILESHIKVGGYALFHDIFYPKSIKNYLIVTFLELSEKWKIRYIDSQSTQGGLVAQKIS